MDLHLSPYAPDIAITSLMTDKSIPIPALIKLYYSDFIVRELDLDGTCVKLKDVTIPSEPELDLYNTYLSEPEKKRLQLSGMILNAPELDYLSLEERDLIASIYSTPRSVSLANESQHFFSMPSDKQARGSIHKFLSTLNRIDIATSTVVDPPGQDGEQTYRLKIQFQKPKFPRPPGVYTHFVMEKAGIDTMQAVNSLVAKIPPQFRCKINDVTYRGTKDKRGVTVQRVCVKGVWPSVLSSISIKSSGMYLQTGNFSFSSEPLRLGAHLGNSFELILRGVPHTASDTLVNRLRNITKKGFINYFGHQRFGSGSIRTHHVGAAILSGQYSDALWMIVQSSIECKFKSTITACNAFKNLEVSVANRDPQIFEDCLTKLLNEIGKSGGAFSSTLRLVKECKNPLVALLKHIPRSMQTVYIHAYQAYLFNLAVSHCVTQIKNEMISGKRCPNFNYLLLNDPVYSRATTTKIENKIHFINDEDLINGDYTFKDLVIPLIGIKTIRLLEDAASHFPQSMLANIYQLYKDTLPFDGLSLDLLSTISQRAAVPKELSSSFRSFIPIGDIRFLFVIPSNVQMCWIKHSSLTDILGVTDMDILAGKRPYTFVDVPASEVSSDNNIDNDNIESVHRSLVLRFSLPSSAYATEFLRELLGTTVDPESQKKILAHYNILNTNPNELDDHE